MVSQLDFNYYSINFHLDIMLGILNYGALDINLSSWDFLDITVYGYRYVFFSSCFPSVCLICLCRYIPVDFISYLWCYTITMTFSFIVFHSFCSSRIMLYGNIRILAQKRNFYLANRNFLLWFYYFWLRALNLKWV